MFHLFDPEQETEGVPEDTCLFLNSVPELEGSRKTCLSCQILNQTLRGFLEKASLLPGPETGSEGVPEDTSFLTVPIS